MAIQGRNQRNQYFLGKAGPCKPLALWRELLERVLVVTNFALQLHGAPHGRAFSVFLYMGNHLRSGCIVNQLASPLPRASWRSVTRRMRNGRIVMMLKYVSVEVSCSKADKTSRKLMFDPCDVSRCRSCGHDCQRSEDAITSPPHAARRVSSSTRFPTMAARPKKGVVGGKKGSRGPAIWNEVHVERLRNSTALWNLRFV